MPRIFIDARPIRPGTGGVATYVRALITRLPELLPDVSFVLLRHPEQTEPLVLLPNVREEVIGGLPHGPKTLFLKRKIQARSDDLFHAPFPIMPWGLPCPVVLTVHEVMWFVDRNLPSTGGFSTRFEAAYHRSVVPQCLRRSQAILTVSETIGREVSERWSWAKEKLFVTHLGAEKQFRPVSSEEGKKTVRRFLPEGTPFFITVGNGSRNKNHETVVRAFGQACKDRPNVHLLVIQRMRMSPPYFREALADSGVSDRIHLIGSVSKEDLAALFSQSLGLVYPSRYEGFALPINEAMTCGCPVITSNTQSLPEVAGDAALLCPPEDVGAVAEAMRKLMDDPKLRTELIQRGFRQASRFSWDDCAQKTLQAYLHVAPHLVR